MADEVIALADVMRHNVLRLRTLRGLTVRALEQRLKVLGSPISSSAVSKIEAGTRAIGIDDWSAIAIALNVPMSALVAVPSPTERGAWSPRTPPEDRAWSLVRQVRVGPSAAVNSGDVRSWFGSGGNLSAVAPVAIPWVAGYTATADYRDLISPGPSETTNENV